MRLFQRILWVGALLLAMPQPAFAAAPPALATPAGLSFAEIKVTGDEFVVLQNNSGADIPDLSQYWLQDFNNVNPLAAGVASSSQQLPAVALDTGQTLLLSAASRNTCGAEVAGKLNVSLTDSGGFLEIVQLGQNNNGAVVSTPGDIVSWSSGAAGTIQNVPSSTKDQAAAYYRYQLPANTFGWQLADVNSTDSCELDVVSGTSKQPAATGSLLSGTAQPPATIMGIDGAGDSPVTGLPAADVGLLAPVVNELLPNPNGTGTDNSDEFIELYNPNAASFDLTGFTLQTGTASTHSYIFPAGASLSPKNFAAFYSSTTGLSLSNSGSQVALLDPFGNVVSVSDQYGTAKDGQTWALANGKWYWTTQPTPGAANVINQPAATSSSKISSKKSTTKTGQVKGASTGTASNGASGLGNTQDVSQVTPIHPWTLALVAGVALLYGAYEYRVDIRNRVAQFRANRAARRLAG